MMEFFETFLTLPQFSIDRNRVNVQFIAVPKQFVGDDGRHWDTNPTYIGDSLPVARGNTTTPFPLTSVS